MHHIVLSLLSLTELATYDNGITLCNDCDSVKHHGKADFGAKFEMVKK